MKIAKGKGAARTEKKEVSLPVEDRKIGKRKAALKNPLMVMQCNTLQRRVQEGIQTREPQCEGCLSCGESRGREVEIPVSCRESSI
ncbi:hypothetical protein OIU74_018784 [Salix koriyanagi]|uniref:Uncharacterized protein n=1 Tax=Salix koriyanagi TaxID=2511006 RepID=A0A9Q1AIF5_9ROSI|nr:hypothetical protein OIU74_018784 [Salix koriyanagi]